MSLLKQMVKEMAAAGSTAAHSVAAVPGGLFAGGVVDGKKAQNKANRGKFKKVSRLRKNPGNMIRRLHQLGESLGASSGETDFSSSDVISKMDAAEKKANAGDDTTAFGMEDEEGNLVKVYVKTDSAEDFEKALGAMLAGEDTDEDNVNSALEIAEVLFKLKDKFEIVDVVWPEIEGDEEEEQEMEGGEEGGGDLGAEGGEDDLGDADPNAEGGDDLNMGDEEGGDMEADGGAASALDKVIDMMKADAEAKKAEADARSAEAKAKEADAVARASQAKVTQEEQILDMETYYKDKADQEKEAKQLAKMAKYKHDRAKEAEGMMANESTVADLNINPLEKDEDEDDNTITPDELATLILKHLRHN